jgi:hypothetical protein
MNADADDDRYLIIAALQRHRVRFVVIGGFAAQLHGWDGVTPDIDVTPDSEKSNLARLAAAVTELDARARVEGYPDGFELPGGIDANTFLRASTFSFVTRHGNLDVVLHPDGIPEGYDELMQHARERHLLAQRVSFHLAELADIVRSKEAAGRVKDRAALPALREMLDS